MRKDLGVKPCIYPEPVLILAAYGEDGVPCAMNAANEVAVERFCNGEINFGSIYRIIDRVMSAWHNEAQTSFAQLQQADCEARRKANEVRL